MQPNQIFIQSVDSMGHLIDRLVVENIKLYDFQRRIEIEQAVIEGERDNKAISDLYRKTCCANEARAAVKNKIDNLLSEAIRAGDYRIMQETRTFAADGQEAVPGRMGENSGTEFQNVDNEDDTHKRRGI
jgi:hypothetical protein